MSWVKKTLDEICTIQKGKIGIKKATPGEFPLVVTAEERLSHNEYHFEGNAVIIPLVSSTGHGHKSLKRIHFQSGKFAVGNILCAVIPKDENILRADYLFRFLYLNKEKELVSRMKGMANVTLPMKEIAKIEIPVPPIDVQIEFVQQYYVLEEKSNDLGAEIENQLNLVEQLRQSFLREAMQGKLLPQNKNDEPASVLLGKIKVEKERLIKEKKIKKQKALAPITEEEIPFEIPENWEWCKLGKPIYYTDNLDIQKNLSPSELINYVDIDSIDNKAYCIREAKLKRVEELSTRARRVLRKGFIVYSTVRPYLRNIAIIEEELPNMIGSTGFNVFKPIGLKPKFVFYFLLNPDLNSAYERMMIGFNSPSITNTQFENTLIPIPPITEQERIVAKLNELMQYCDDLAASIIESKEQNELLLQQVLSEALEPKEKEVAE
jgi:type I restriction enzyme S subunit